MMPYFSPAMPVIDEDNLDEIVAGKSRGLIPRDRTIHPEGCFAFAEPFPDEMLIPQGEWAARIQEQHETKSGLLDLRETYYGTLKSLDQNGLGLCWAFSTTKAMMYLRKLMNEPDMILSAWWVAGKVKGWRDQGGWGGESLAYIVANGVPSMELCPSYRSSYDTAATRENAALHKAVEWWEGSSDPNKAYQQMVSALLRGLPCIADFDNISHSMCIAGMQTATRVIADNSWGESSGDRGLYAMEGRTGRPNGLWVPRVMTPSPS